MEFSETVINYKIVRLIRGVQEGRYVDGSNYIIIFNAAILILATIQNKSFSSWSN